VLTLRDRDLARFERQQVYVTLSRRAGSASAQHHDTQDITEPLKTTHKRITPIALYYPMS
jgi:hypothetical protein